MQLEIREFQKLIKELPYLKHSFDIKKKNWKVQSQQSLINEVFDANEVITLNRYDLKEAIHFDLKLFILKTLMWGYPTKGRGNNLNNLLKDEKFELLTSTLYKYHESTITIKQLSEDIKSIPGLGLSTMSKFVYFLDARLDGHKTLILDNRIIQVINSDSYKELNGLKGIRSGNAILKYPLYCETMDKLAQSIDVESDQIEMFLFMFGSNLSRVYGEHVYDVG
ncbi:8-oxoguanine DNA glycosylase OGG fold protein [Psychroflexus montanilacus]|uniref:8-oxoguanine DNA glycosylase OGG fold protein n=1 Tax=Psychroflexus montanilacus TaxID=2873598 RepID=UPI001CCACC36|nr:hypothetical protein [Psychroflexus montanilacus]MBZ9652660.1 hypothetical protein [Psychroflexus montanilacus]